MSSDAITEADFDFNGPLGGDGAFLLEAPPGKVISYCGYCWHPNDEECSKGNGQIKKCRSEASARLSIYNHTMKSPFHEEKADHEVSLQKAREAEIWTYVEDEETEPPPQGIPKRRAQRSSRSPRRGGTPGPSRPRPEQRARGDHRHAHREEEPAHVHGVEVMTKEELQDAMVAAVERAGVGRTTPGPSRAGFGCGGRGLDCKEGGPRARGPPSLPSTAGANVSPTTGRPGPAAGSAADQLRLSIEGPARPTASPDPMLVLGRACRKIGTAAQVGPADQPRAPGPRASGRRAPAAGRGLGAQGPGPRAQGPRPGRPLCRRRAGPAK